MIRRVLAMLIKHLEIIFIEIKERAKRELRELIMLQQTNFNFCFSYNWLWVIVPDGKKVLSGKTASP